MLSDKEAEAIKAVQEALKAIQRARELCERVEYGMLVLEPLADAQCGTQCLRYRPGQELRKTA